VLPYNPAIHVKAIGVRWLHEEEGKDDDIQSKDEVIVRILACKPDKIKGKGQDKMRN